MVTRRTAAAALKRCKSSSKILKFVVCFAGLFMATILILIVLVVNWQSERLSHNDDVLIQNGAAGILLIRQPSEERHAVYVPVMGIAEDV